MPVLNKDISVTFHPSKTNSHFLGRSPGASDSYQVHAYL